MQINPAIQIDGYKVDHKRQYPANTQVIFSNLTARKTRRLNCDHIVFFGLQYFIKEFLIKQWNENFFQQPIETTVEAFNRRINNYLGPNQVGDQHLRDLHALGYLPIAILALPEGTVHGYKIPSMVIYNTHENFGWLTNYLETILSTTIWGACTSATTAHQYKKLLKKFALETTGGDDFVQWQGHDFSFRGMFGMEAACISGGAHLLFFTGTDTIPAIDWLERYYNANSDKELVGGSVPATEHSVMCAGGAEDEVGTYRRLINEIYPSGIVSIVSDTWDYWNVLTNTAKTLKNEILCRNGKVVFRPDTGDPVKVVIGDLEAPVDSPEYKGSIECLWEIFGGTITEQGYKVLDSHVGLIYGDPLLSKEQRRFVKGWKRRVLPARILFLVLAHIPISMLLVIRTDLPSRPPTPKSMENTGKSSKRQKPMTEQKNPPRVLRQYLRTNLNTF